MDDKKFLEGLAKDLEATSFVKAIAEMRKLYKVLKTIADYGSPGNSKEEKLEAEELTKDGFYSFVGKVVIMNGGFDSARKN